MRTLKRFINNCVIIVILSLILLGCEKQGANSSIEPVSKSDFYLDTIVDIRIYDSIDNVDEVFEQAFNRIGELENILSVHIEGSDLYKIKESAGINPVEVSDETLYVIEKSIYYSQISNGYFDITAGPLIDLWRIDPPTGYVPTQKELDIALNKINYKDIIIDKNNSTVMLKEKGMIANLGAIAKGYIADEVKKVLIDNGVEHAIINLGGNVMLLGDKPDGSDYSIGIQDPSSDRNSYLGLIKISDYSLVSSGDYERYFIQDGKKYHHILNPFTGYPADNEIRQVTIISSTSLACDSLSTTTFLLGLEEGLKLLENLEGVEGVFITSDNQVVLTSGIGDSFVFDEHNYGSTYTVIKNTTN